MAPKKKLTAAEKARQITRIENEIREVNTRPGLSSNDRRQLAGRLRSRKNYLKKKKVVPDTPTRTTGGGGGASSSQTGLPSLPVTAPLPSVSQNNSSNLFDSVFREAENNVNTDIVRRRTSAKLSPPIAKNKR